MCNSSWNHFAMDMRGASNHVTCWGDMCYYISKQADFQNKQTKQMFVCINLIWLMDLIWTESDLENWICFKFFWTWDGKKHMQFFFFWVTGPCMAAISWALSPAHFTWTYGLAFAQTRPLSICYEPQLTVTQQFMQPGVQQQTLVPFQTGTIVT